MITGITELKTLIEENLIQISGEVKINANVDVKNMYVKKIMFGILLNVVVKMENI